MAPHCARAFPWPLSWSCFQSQQPHVMLVPTIHISVHAIYCLHSTTTPTTPQPRASNSCAGLSPFCKYCQCAEDVTNYTPMSLILSVDQEMISVNRVVPDVALPPLPFQGMRQRPSLTITHPKGRDRGHAAQYIPEFAFIFLLNLSCPFSDPTRQFRFQYCSMPLLHTPPTTNLPFFLRPYTESTHIKSPIA